MILISQYKIRVWYKEDLRWIVNNHDGDWMQNSCNKNDDTMFTMQNVIGMQPKQHKLVTMQECHKKKLEIRESKK